MNLKLKTEMYRWELNRWRLRHGKKAASLFMATVLILSAYCVFFGGG